jgi:hypothetical protein
MIKWRGSTNPRTFLPFIAIYDCKLCLVSEMDAVRGRKCASFMLLLERLAARANFAVLGLARWRFLPFLRISMTSLLLARIYGGYFDVSLPSCPGSVFARPRASHSLAMNLLHAYDRTSSRSHSIAGLRAQRSVRMTSRKDHAIVVEISCE